MRCMALPCCSSKSRTARPPGSSIRNSSAPVRPSPSSGFQAVSNVRPSAEFERPEGSAWAPWWPFPCVSAIFRSSSLYPQEPCHCGCKLVDLLVGLPRFLGRLTDAVLNVVPEQEDPSLLNRGDDASNLGKDVDAVGFLVHHPLHAPHLSLDPLEAVPNRLLVLRLDVPAAGHVLDRRRCRHLRVLQRRLLPKVRYTPVG